MANTSCSVRSGTFTLDAATSRTPKQPVTAFRQNRPFPPAARLDRNRTASFRGDAFDRDPLLWVCSRMAAHQWPEGMEMDLHYVVSPPGNHAPVNGWLSTRNDGLWNRSRGYASV